MKKNVWIFNHYAGDMFVRKNGRHLGFAKSLAANGYKPVIFCANTLHILQENREMNCKFEIDYVDDIPFVFVKTYKYKGNGIKRILNMISFYMALFSVARIYSKEHGKPDIILASSVHPLTLVAGIKIAKRFNVPCICEVRDLWPESIAVYKHLNNETPLFKLMYAGEKWIYKKASRLIFTMEGGKDYVKERYKDIDQSKICYINNGVDISSFDYNKEHFAINKDEDLNNPDTIKIVYTGSIRPVNNVGMILDAAKMVKNPKVKFLIWGGGICVDNILSRISDEHISNVVYKGVLDHKYTAYVNSIAYANIFSCQHDAEKLFRYGMSMNKLFEYLAAGKPIILPLLVNQKYNIVNNYDCGITIESSPHGIVKAVDYLMSMSKDEYNEMCKNAQLAAHDFDFKVLTQKLIQVIEGC